MKRIIRIGLVGSVCLVIGFVCGWLLKPGELTPSVSLQVDDREISNEKRFSVRSDLSAQTSKEVDRADARMMGIMNESDSRKRARLWLDYVDSLQVEQFDQALESLRFWKHAGGDTDLSLVIKMIFVRYGQEAPLDAIEYIGSLNHNERWESLMTMFAGWAEVDLNAALSYFDSPANAVLLLDTRLGDALKRVIGRTAAKVNLDGAIAWVAALDENQSPDVAFQGILHYVSGVDPSTATELAMKFDYGNKEEMVNETVMRWARQDSEGALEWVQSLSDSKLSDLALESVIRGWASKDVEAAGWYVAGLDYSNKVKLLRDITREWTAENPVDASHWVKGLRESDAKNAAMRELVPKWAADDPEGASMWLSELPNGDAKDSGIQGLAEKVIETDPEAAVIWAGSISDETLRTRNLRALVTQWMNGDGHSAYTWLRYSDSVPKEERQALLDYLVSTEAIRGNVAEVE